MDSIRARASLDEAIKRISNVEKAAYLEALKRAPHLVETESDPLCFLQRDGYDYCNAAGRITAYWEERRKFFGDRAFLPLTLVGASDNDSALSEEAVRFIRSDAFLLLPNDSSGRSVICCLQDKFRKYPIDMALQALFYHHFILMRNTQNREGGYVFIIRGDNAGDARRRKLLIELLRKAMPLKMHSIYFLTEDGLNPIIFNLWKWYSNEKAYAHLCKTSEECGAVLKTYGFKKERLPKVLGGSWETVQWDGLNIVMNDPRNTAGSNGFQQEYGIIHNRPGFFEDNASSSLLTGSIGTTGTGKPHDLQSLPAPPAIKEDHIGLTKKLAGLESIPVRTKSPKTVPHGTGEFDVLLGKGSVHAGHLGNQRLRALVESRCAHYKAAKSRIDKKQIRVEILNFIEEKGRIMKYDDDSNAWKEVSSAYSLEKIGEALQNALRKKR